MRNIAGVILAGGRSSRFGAPKDEALLQGVALLDHVIARAGAQVGVLAISRATEEAQNNRGLHVVVDSVDHGGPLAGLVAGLEWASQLAGVTHLAAFACDTPLFPLDLVDNLYNGAGFARTPVAMPMVKGEIYPTLGLWQIGIGGEARRRLQCGEGALWKLAQDTGLASVSFDGREAAAFFNVNTPADLAALETMLGSSARSGE